MGLSIALVVSIGLMIAIIIGFLSSGDNGSLNTWEKLLKIHYEGKNRSKEIDLQMMKEDTKQQMLQMGKL